MSTVGDGAVWLKVQELRSESIGRLLIAASRRYNDLAIRYLQANGHPGLTAAHASLLPHVDLDGLRLTDLASRAGMTKQSASELVGSLERLGYLSRAPDPDDGRAQRVTFTDRGREFLLAAYDAKLKLEAKLVARLGTSAYAELQGALRAVCELEED